MTISQRRPLDWVNIAFLTLTPLVAVFGTAWYGWHYGVTKLELGLFFVMYAFTGMGITAGYHRYFSHRTYDCSRALQLFYLIFGAAAVENSVLHWCSDHRYHHQFVDTDEDPYNILRGGLYAHMGWIFYKDTRDHKKTFVNIPDLVKDPLVAWQDRWYLFLVVAVCFGLPTLVGALAGRPVGGLLWGGFLRVVIVQHATFFINSLAHLWGTKPYSLKDTARDNGVLGLVTFGEGYHNFHHKFQADYRNGYRWYQIDVTKWWLLAMRWLGQAWKLKRTPEPLILRAKLQVQMEQVDQRLAAVNAPERMLRKIAYRLERGRRRFEHAYAQYQVAKIEHRKQRDLWTEEMRQQWHAKAEVYKAELTEARHRWRDLMKAMERLPRPTPQQAFSLMAVFDLFKGKHF
jgi:stearoyl-CoA desaturase (Delta-9 desaturase)